MGQMDCLPHLDRQYHKYTDGGIVCFLKGSLSKIPIDRERQRRLTSTLFNIPSRIAHILFISILVYILCSPSPQRSSPVKDHREILRRLPLPQSALTPLPNVLLATTNNAAVPASLAPPPVLMAGNASARVNVRLAHPKQRNLV